ncbi:response regulator [Amedibacillus sp. YH-ame10]
MNIIAVDDERIALNLLVNSIKEVLPREQVFGYISGEEALKFHVKEACEIAFLDIDMAELDGISLAKRLKITNPRINIIFVTAYKDYAIQALNIHSSGYVMKPVTKEKIKNELDNLRYSISIFKTHDVWIQCFGNFEIFIEGQPVKFMYKKTKELLAFLVDRKGSFCTNGEIIANLWEDDASNYKKSSYLRDLRSDLIKTLSKLGVENIIYKSRGVMAIATSNVACDYYDWLQGDNVGINAYHGEYMSQFSWSEFTRGGLEVISSK